MGHEHDDDMDPEVSEGPTGETEHYAGVVEELEERDADEAESARARESQDARRKAQEEDVDEG